MCCCCRFVGGSLISSTGASPKSKRSRATTNPRYNSRVVFVSSLWCHSLLANSCDADGGVRCCASVGDTGAAATTRAQRARARRTARAAARPQVCLCVKATIRAVSLLRSSQEWCCLVRSGWQCKNGVTVASLLQSSLEKKPEK